jgi:ParB-like chromosome segregation protein Spo0J
MLKMEFFFKKAYADLIPKLTARDYERLKKSIKEYGQQYPIIVNSDFVILD